MIADSDRSSGAADADTLTSEGFCTIDEAIEELRAGRMIVLVDDEHRENEGDLVIAAEKVTPQAINFMIRQACGRLCLAMSGPMCDRVGLTLLPGVHLDPSATPFTHNFDARHGITTGISAFDRATTDPDRHRRPLDPARPRLRQGPRRRPAGPRRRRAGPGRAHRGERRPGRLAGLKPAAVICEVVREDGYMARLPDLKEFCAKHGLKMCTIADLIKYRRHREKLVQREIALKLPTAHGTFDLFAYLVDRRPGPAPGPDRGRRRRRGERRHPGAGRSRSWSASTASA